MTVTTTVELMREAFLVGLALALPLLLVSLVIGLILGVIQAATGVQEFTLTFVPKLLAVFALILLLGPVGLSLATEFAVRMLMLIPQIAR
jgi:flagellar biosynthetic protein FliQ